MIENISPCDTWQCINSFALWFSGIGTFSVSALALWLSVKDRFIKLRASFNTAIIPGDDPNVLNKSVFILDFTNIGQMPITITNFEWRLPFNRKKKIITFPHLEPTLSHLCSKLPKELLYGQSGQFFHLGSFFRTINSPETFMYPKNRIIAFLRIHFFKIYINTSIGKNIQVTVISGVRQKLWKEYLSLEL